MGFIRDLVSSWIRHYLYSICLEIGLTAHSDSANESDKLALYGSLKFVVLSLMAGLEVQSVDIDFDEEGVLVDEVDAVKYSPWVVPLKQVTSSGELTHQYFEGDIVDTLSRVVWTSWRNDLHQVVGLLVLLLHQLDGHVLPVPHHIDSEELDQQFVGIMIREDLTDFGDQDGPRDTSQVSHLIRTYPAVLSPYLDQAQSRSEPVPVLDPLEQQHIVFPTKD